MMPITKDSKMNRRNPWIEDIECDIEELDHLDLEDQLAYLLQEPSCDEDGAMCVAANWERNY